MKKILCTILAMLIISPASFAGSLHHNLFKLGIFDSNTRAIKSLLNSQIKYANQTNFDKFISTFDKEYLNADGFNLDTYSNIVKDVWQTYDKITYGIKINNITVKDDNSAEVSVIETSYAKIPSIPNMDGILESASSSIYYLKKTKEGWKVVSDKVLTEDTSMLYGDAKNLDIELIAPEVIESGKEYTASLAFTPPKGSIVIASIAKDRVTYPQEQPKEVYRKFPDDNILERLFISNKDNLNEYIIASIGLTKADIDNMTIKLSLTGYGYKIVRVNVVQPSGEDMNVQN